MRVKLCAQGLEFLGGVWVGGQFAAALDAAVGEVGAGGGVALLCGRAWCRPVRLCFVRSHARPGEGGPQRHPTDMEKMICKRGGH